MRKRIRAVWQVTIAAAVGSIGQVAMAQTDNWTQTAGGPWSTAGNWSLSAPPTQTQNALFNTGSASPYTVTFATGSAEAYDLTIQNDSVTFDSTGNSAESLVSNALDVTATAGQSASLTLQGTPGGYGIETNDNVGGNFAVGGAGATTLIDNGVNITSDGNGYVFGPGSTVTVTNATLKGSDGAGIDVEGTATFEASVAGGVIVGGPGPSGATWNGGLDSIVSGALQIGSSAGMGTANAGGQFEVVDVSNGTLSGGVGATTVNVGGDSPQTGVLSGLEYASLLTVEANGILNPSPGSSIAANNINFSGGTLASTAAGILLLQGGTLSDTALTIPTALSLQGIGSLTGSLTNDGNLQPGSTSSFGITFTTGRLTVDGNYNQSADATLVIPLAGSSGLDPGVFTGPASLLAVDGTTTLAGTLDVTAPSGFPLSLGESFDILALGSETGEFSNIELPPLPGGLGWDTQDLYTTGIITVVPEPVTTALLAASGAAMLGRRYRKRALV